MSQFFDLMYNVCMQELIERLRGDYPNLRLREGERFCFRPPRTIIFVLRSDNVEQNSDALQLLHEVGHALLEHKNFATDPERLRMERAAWEKARELCEHYGVCYDEEFVEEELDTYRNWLHQRSRCPQCGLTRYQTVDGKYHCPSCEE